MKDSSIPQSNPFPNHDADGAAKAADGSGPASGRGPNGRFCKGNAGGPGNPFAREVAAMRQEFLKAVTAEDVAAIARAMIAKAKEGDVAAAKVVLQYTLGKPAQAVDPDRLDEGEWQQWQREVVHTSEADAVFEACAAETICKIARIFVPHMQQKMLDGMAATVQEREAARQKREAAGKQRETASPGAHKARGGERAGETADHQEKAAPMAPAARTAEAPAGREPRGKVSSVEAPKEEPDGQRAPRESREDVVNRVLHMLGGTVNKPGQTARRAANDFDEAERPQAPPPR
jgi:hypothetical protein